MESTSYKRVANNAEDKQASSAALPPFDASEWTHITNFVAVGSGAIFSLVCIVTSIVNLNRNPGSHLARLPYRPAVIEGTSLVINLALTFTTESLAFIHSASLRWALADEGQLQFNTNIRLLTTSRRNGPNRWWVNGLSLATLMLCYGSTSILFVTSIVDWSVETSATLSDTCLCCSAVCGNMIALLALGIGLAVQTVVAAWCLAVSGTTKIHGQPAIPTWSSNPLNAALTGLWRGLFSHRDGRCMAPVRRHDTRTDEHSVNGALPVARQDNAWKAHRAVSYVVYLLWGLAVAAIVWPIIIAVVVAEFWEYAVWSWTPDNRNAVILAMSPAENSGESRGPYFSFAAELVLGLLFVTVIQAIQTTGLHCTELLVNLSRDESAWRQATGKHGATYHSAPFYAAATSWENLTLFMAKAVLHWIIGQSLMAQVGYVVLGDKSTKKGAVFFTMIWSRLVIYAACAVFMAVFATFLASRKPKGPQPATWGHLQTLADLIDNWKTDKNGKFWWGDTTSLLASASEMDTSVRHAGMSEKREKLGEIYMDSPYAGRGLTGRRRV